MAEYIRGFPGPRVVIDHHVSQDDLGATFLKDTTAEATGTLVMSRHRSAGRDVHARGRDRPLDGDRHGHRLVPPPQYSPGRSCAAAELVEAGAQIDTIYRLLFERNTLGRLKLMGETLAGLKTDLDGRVAYATITRDDLARTGAIPQDSEDLVDFTVSLRGVEVGLLFIEQARGGVKVSFRSRNGLDCARLAATLGGGGHRARGRRDPGRPARRERCPGGASGPPGS